MKHEVLKLASRKDAQFETEGIPLAQLDSLTACDHDF